MVLHARDWAITTAEGRPEDPTPGPAGAALASERACAIAAYDVDPGLFMESIHIVRTYMHAFAWC